MPRIYITCHYTLRELPSCFLLFSSQSLIPVDIGMLAFSEIIIQLEQQLGRKEAREVITFSSKPEDRFITLKEYVECLKTLIRSSIAGTVVGALPGLGAPVASFFAYDQAVTHSKEPEGFGLR